MTTAAILRRAAEIAAEDGGYWSVAVWKADTHKNFERNKFIVRCALGQSDISFDSVNHRILGLLFAAHIAEDEGL